uniref:Uncharacterized protein n=1 Tax=Populus trichocarpa TaxID=3694 RepID=U5G807_POPTR
MVQSARSFSFEFDIVRCSQLSWRAPAAVNHVFLTSNLTKKSSNLTMCFTDSLCTNFCWPEMPFLGSSENWSCTVTFDVSTVG